MKLSEKIYLLRKEKGMTQDELAAKCNVSRQSVSKWEATDAKPDIDSIRLLAKTFEMSIDDFLNVEILHPVKTRSSNVSYIAIILSLVIALISGLVVGYNMRPQFDERLFSLQEVKIETINMTDYVQLTVRPYSYQKDMDIELHLYNSEDLGNNHDSKIISMKGHDDALVYTAQFTLPVYDVDGADMNQFDFVDISINMVKDDYNSKLVPLWNDVWLGKWSKKICMLNNQSFSSDADSDYLQYSSFVISRSALEQK